VDGKLERVEGDGWREALQEYEDWLTVEAPRGEGGLLLKTLCNHFLTAKPNKKNAGELGGRVFAEHKNVTDLLVKTFGANRLVDDLRPEDFAQLRGVTAKRWGPVRMVTEIVRVKTVFEYAAENGLTEKPVAYGSEFKPPSASLLRRHRAKSGGKLLEAEEVRSQADGALGVGATGPEFIAGVDPVMRAMVLLGVNCRMGNIDCAALVPRNLDLEHGWLDYPRPRTSAG